MSLGEMFTLLSVVVSFASVCVALVSVRASRQIALNGTYFSEMAQPYSEYLKCVSAFVYRRGLPERDELAASLYRLLLFAPSDIACEAQELYNFLFQWAGTNPIRALDVDEKTNRLGELMRLHLASACRRGRL